MIVVGSKVDLYENYCPLLISTSIYLTKLGWITKLKKVIQMQYKRCHDRDVNEPLQARGSTRSARKFRCSKVARLEIGSKIFCSIFARLEKCSKNFGSRSTLFEILRLEMLASLKRANFWKKLQGIYCQYCT